MNITLSINYGLFIRDESAFEEVFKYSCPKFISPEIPSYKEESVLDPHEPARLQLELFMTEIRQQQELLALRSYLNLYSSIQIRKLAGFFERKSVDDVRFV